jgi:hypothetical protein
MVDSFEEYLRIIKEEPESVALNVLIASNA